MIVDCDCHNHWRSDEVLLPYLDHYHRDFFNRGEMPGPPGAFPNANRPWLHPEEFKRMDINPETEEDNYRLMQEKHLDRHDITFAIRTGEVSPGRQMIVTINDRQVGMFEVHGAQDALRIVCPHRGGPLCEGPQCGTGGDPGDFRVQYDRKDERASGRGRSRSRSRATTSTCCCEGVAGPARSGPGPRHPVSTSCRSIRRCCRRT